MNVRIPEIPYVRANDRFAGESGRKPDAQSLPLVTLSGRKRNVTGTAVVVKFFSVPLLTSSGRAGFDGAIFYRHRQRGCSQPSAAVSPTDGALKGR
jgi:hypothetical protein